jgi:hypothetical protein|tara:strand:- start:57 stop:212 length:156 start_codon:yes stop_codon:yes gene_type:complete
MGKKVTVVGIQTGILEFTDAEYTAWNQNTSTRNLDDVEWQVLDWQFEVETT